MIRPFVLFVERAAEKELNRLPENIFRRIVAHIKELAHNPRPAGSRKIMGSANDWRIRIGDYRVIYEIDETERALRIMKVRHRREAYR
jgi:mRNA interferase RelE/StbE